MICPKCEFKNAFETNKTKHKYVGTSYDFFNYCPNCDYVWIDAKQRELNHELWEMERIEKEKARRKEEEEATPAAKAARRKKNLQKDLDSLMALNPFTYLKKINPLKGLINPLYHINFIKKSLKIIGKNKIIFGIKN